MKAQILCDRIIELLNGWLKEEGSEIAARAARQRPRPAMPSCAARRSTGWARRAKAKACASAAAWRVRTTSASKPRCPPSPATSRRSRRCAWFRSGWKKAWKPKSPAPNSAWSSVSARLCFLSSTMRRDDRVGMSIEDWQEMISELGLDRSQPARHGSAFVAGTLVPVVLQSKVTAVGTLELWCHARDGHGQWKLELNVRE